MGRFFGAVGAFFVTLFVLVFALAVSETATGWRFTVLGSRNALVPFGLGIAVLVARFRFRAKPHTAATVASAAPGRQPLRSDGAVPERAASTDAALAKALAALQPVAGARAAIPAGPTGIDPAIRAAARQAVVFRKYFPPPHDDEHVSFFGGVPIAPAGFAWPRAARADGASRPLHFLLQIDCGEVPAAARLGLLPDHGVLHVFLDLEWGEGGGCRIIHSNARTGDWAPVAVPADLGPAYGKEACFHWPWAPALADCPATLPRWPFQPVAVTFTPGEGDDADAEASGNPYDLPEITDFQGQIIAAQGEPVTWDAISVREISPVYRTMVRPFANYPQDWRAVQIAAARMLKTVERRRGDRNDFKFKDMPAAERTAFFDAVAGEAQDWFDAAQAEPPFDAVPADRSDACWRWLADRHDVSLLGLVDSITLAIEASLAASAEAAARVPDAVARRLHGRHALAVRTERGFHISTPDRMLALASDVQGNQWDRAATHLLLLEISSNDGIGHFFGEGVYQFWITPEDLNARRFDRVVLTSDAY